MNKTQDALSAENDLQDIPALVERAKQEWEATADALPQLVCLLDDQKRILRVNRTVERWEMAQVTDVKGQNIHELFHPGCTDPDCYLDTFWHQAWEELARGRSAECEARDEILKRHLHVQVQPIATTTDKLRETAASYAAVVVHDITARKRIEKQLRQQKRLAAVGQLA
ncbi:MAG: PAS domain-containing protein, partial [Chloroflexota bacterium]|nr:PAS domain-containing protein [Chloroflexota bacterium]